MNDQSNTPRTDAVASYMGTDEQLHHATNPDHLCINTLVKADFARQLETELQKSEQTIELLKRTSSIENTNLVSQVTQLETELADANKRADEWKRMAEELAKEKQEPLFSQRQLPIVIAEHDQLKRQVEELRSELEEYRSIAEKIGAKKAVSERDQLRARNAELLKALQTIAHQCPCDNDGRGCPCADVASQAIDEARE